jgi:endonuclease/exonuclease/phosphatase (EEP) superfamily protein YafD
MSQTLHEDYSSRSEIKQGSDRSFGMVFSAAFALVGLYLVSEGHTHYEWAFLVSITFLLIGLLKPALLKPLNIIWLKFGLLLSVITIPLTMGLVFFLIVTPTGFIMRALRKDLLNLKLDRAEKSYWVERDPPGPKAESMVNQF